MLKISQNNDNRGRHLEFYFHKGIGNWFQCFPVYPGLNLTSGSGSDCGSGSGSGFRIPDSSSSIRLSNNQSQHVLLHGGVSLSISLKLKLTPVPYATPKWPILTLPGLDCKTVRISAHRPCHGFRCHLDE